MRGILMQTGVGFAVCLSAFLDRTPVAARMAPTSLGTSQDEVSFLFGVGGWARLCPGPQHFNARRARAGHVAHLVGRDFSGSDADELRFAWRG